MAVCTGPPSTGMDTTTRNDNSNLLEDLMSEFDRKKSFSGQLEADEELDENSNQTNGDSDLIPRDADAKGAAEFAVYCKNLGRPRSPPPKPKRNKSRNMTSSTDSSTDRPSSISSELQEIIESAFGNERAGDEPPNNSSSIRLEMPAQHKNLPSTPYPTPEHDLTEPDFDARARGVSAPVHRTPVFHDGSVTPGRSASFDSMAFIDDEDAESYGDERHDTIARKSLNPPAFDTISFNSALSDSMDWTPDDFLSEDMMGNPETASVVSFSLTPSTSPVGAGTKDSKTRRKEMLRKHISKAVAQKEKMGALFDVAAGNASDQLKKIKRIRSVRFPGAKSRHGKSDKLNANQKSLDSNGQLTDAEEGSKLKLPPLPEELRVKPVYKTNQNGRQMATKSGYLKKQGGKIKTWNERWFALAGDQLHYYKEMDGKYIASIFLPGKRVATHVIRPNDANKYVFEIFPGSDGQKMANNHESYLLSANSQTDMEDWVKAIRRVILSPFGGGIFGQRLDETLRYDRRLDSSGSGTTSTGGRSVKSGESERRQAPIIVENCVEFIRNHGGFKEEGLFRLPGHANEVKDLQDAYDMGDRPVFPSSTDVHTVASLLKGYLRELPEPIIPYDRYDPLISCAKTSMADGSDAGSDAAEVRRQEEKSVIKEQLNLLPQVNFDLLRYMCRFLDEVQRHSDVNKMDISNLAMVFGPNIMRSKRDDPHTMMSDASLVQHVMFQFIDNHRLFFPDDEKTTPVSSLHSLPDVAMDAAGAVSAPDAGIGTLTSTAASPPGTLTQNRHTDDSGTGSMGPTPESTSKRAPPVPVLPPPIRGKPNKPLRRKTSGQGLTPSRNGSPGGEVTPGQRKSLYDNVTASSNASSDATPPLHAYLSHKHDWRSSNESTGGLPQHTRPRSTATSATAPESYYVNNHSTPPSLSSATPRSSTNAVAGSIGEVESCHSSPNDYPPSSRSDLPNKRRVSRKFRRENGGCVTDEESNTESVPPDDRAFSTISSKRSSFRHDSDYRKEKNATGKVPRPELSATLPNRLSMDSVSDEASSASSNAPPIPSRPHRKNKKSGSGQNTGSERNSRSETEMTNDVNHLASNRSSQLPSSTANSVFGSALTYKELEEQVKALQEELRKQRIEHEKRSRMLEEHYIMKMKSSTSMYSPFSASLPGYPNPHSPSSVSGASDAFSRAGLLDDSTTDPSEGPLSPGSGRQSADSQPDVRYKEEVKKHAMTKIRLRNAERGLQQADERNKQLQKEMEEFFHTFGSMMNAETPTSY